MSRRCPAALQGPPRSLRNWPRARSERAPARLIDADLVQLQSLLGSRRGDRHRGVAHREAASIVSMAAPMPDCLRGAAKECCEPLEAAACGRALVTTDVPRLPHAGARWRRSPMPSPASPPIRFGRPHGGDNRPPGYPVPLRKELEKQISTLFQVEVFEEIAKPALLPGRRGLCQRNVFFMVRVNRAFLLYA